jgi:hypothetical protein
MSLLRVLIPSWKFFDSPGSLTRLEFQTSPDGKTWSSWTSPKAPAVSRGVLQLFLNPWENAWLAQTALVEKLCAEFFDLNLKSLSEMKSLDSYRLVVYWVRTEIQKLSHQEKYFHFKIEIQNSGAEATTLTLASSVHEI